MTSLARQYLAKRAGYRADRKKCEMWSFADETRLGGKEDIYSRPLC